MNRLRQVPSLVVLIVFLIFVPSLSAQNSTSVELTVPVSSTLGDRITFQVTVSDGDTNGTNLLGGTIQILDVTLTPEIVLGVVQTTGAPVSVTVLWKTASLAAGSHQIRAVYSPVDATNFNPGSSSVHTVNVGARGTTTVLGPLNPASVTVRGTSSTTVFVSDAAGSLGAGKFASTSTYDLKQPRQGHTATAIPQPDGSFQILVVGGEVGNSPLASGKPELYTATGFDVFSPLSGSFADRTGATATLLKNGTVLIVGGHDGGNGSPKAEIYDPVAQTVGPLNGPNTPDRYNHAAVLLPDGRVALMGGIDSGQNPTVLDTVAIYDPLTTQSVFAGPLAVPRAGLSATLLNSGDILVVGGGDPSFELYSVANGTSKKYDFSNAPSFHAAALLPDGNVLLAGGSPSNQNVWLYESQSNRFVAVTDPLRQMQTARAGHTATVLPDGTVLVIGGIGDQPTPAELSTAEVYTPSFDPGGAISFSGDSNLSFANCDLTLSGSGVATCTAAVTPQHYGNGIYGISATYAGSVNHLASTSSSQQMTVTKQQLRLVAQPDTRPYDSTTDSSLQPTVTGTLSGDIVGAVQLFASKDAFTSIQIDPALTSILDAGGQSVVDDYVVVELKPAIGAITSRKVTIVPEPSQSKVYGGTDPSALMYDVGAAGLAGSDQESDAFSGSLARNSGEIAGTYPIALGSLTAKLNGNGVANYEITSIVAENFSITKRPIGAKADSGQAKVYGEADPVTLTFTATAVSGDPVSGLVPADTPANVFSGALSRNSGNAVGSYVINKNTLSVNGNYDLQEYVSANFQISKRPIGVKANAGQNKVYGEDDPVFSYVATAVNGDPISGLASSNTADNTPDTASKVFVQSLSRAQAGTPAGQAVASYAITQGSLSVNPNYANYDLQQFTPDTFSVTKRSIALTVNPNQNKIYGEADPVLTFSGSAVSGNPASGLAATNTSSGVADTAAVVFTGTLVRAQAGTPAGQGVGSYAIAQGSVAVSSANYNLNGFNGDSFTITKRPIGAHANTGQTKVYGEGEPAQLTFVATSVAGKPISGLATSNTASGSSDQQGDVFTGALVRIAGQAAAAYAINQGSLEIKSTYANYDLQQYASENFTISKRPIAANVTPAQTKVYGESDPVFAFTAASINGIASSGLATSNTATGAQDQQGNVFSGALSRSSVQAAGAYAITKGTLQVNGNYDLQQVTNETFTISKRPVGVKANAGQTKVYGETDPVLTFSGVAVAGNPISGLATANTASGQSDVEAVVFSGALTRAQANTPAGQAVGGSYAITQGSVTVSSGYANYDLQQFTSDQFVIMPRPIGAHATPGQTKVYGESDPAAFAFAATTVNGKPVSGLATSNTITGTPDQITDVFTGALGRVSGQAVGAYSITQNTLAVNGNYVFEQYVPENLAITQRPIGAKVNAGQIKTYGENDPAFTFIATGVSGNPISGLASNDTANGAPDTQGDVFSGVLSRVSGQAVGTYPINLGTLAVNGNYALQQFGSDDFSITKRAIAVSVNPQGKLYGQLDPAILVYTAIAVPGNPASGLATTNTASGVPDTQAAVFSGTPQRAPGEAAGMYGVAQNTVTVNGNYDLQPTNFSGGSFVISPSNTFTTKLTQAVVANSSGAYKITINVAYDPSSNGSACHQELAGIGNAGCIPDNTVSLKEGSTVLDTETLSSGATTSKALILSPGQHTVAITYNGSLNFASSVKTVILNVAAGPTTSVQPSSTPVSVTNVLVSNIDVASWPVAGVVSLASDASGVAGFDALKPNYLGCAVIWTGRTINSKPTCEVVNPPSSIPSGGNATFSVNIKTAAFSASVRPAPGDHVLRELYTLTLGFPAIVFIGLAGTKSRHDRKQNRRVLTAIGVLLIALWGIGLAGCGGGSFTNPNNKQPVFGTQETEAGSYAAVIYYAPTNFASSCQTTTCIPEPMSTITFTIGQ